MLLSVRVWIPGAVPERPLKQRVLWEFRYATKAPSSMYDIEFDESA